MRFRDGLMWFDNSPRTDFPGKLKEAADAYERRFKQRATICYVNPGDFPEDLVQTDDLAVVAEPTVLKHHFYVGVAGSGGRA
jgi:hypothetical protein